jgi:hypothetical protein
MKLTSVKGIRRPVLSTFNLRLRRRGSPNRTLIGFLTIIVLLLTSLPRQAQALVGPYTASALENTFASALTLQPDTDSNGRPLSQNQYKIDAATKAKVEAALGRMPLYFVENRGQLDRRVAYYVQGSDTSIYFTSKGMTLALTGPAASSRNKAASLQKGSSQAESLRRIAKEEGSRQRWTVKVDFVGANPNVKPAGRDRTSAIISQFKGPKQQWKTGLNTYSSVVYTNLWPGIDMVYSGTANQLKYSFIVKPGADPNQIKLAYRGAKEVKINNKGQLEVATSLGSIIDEKPYSYQEKEGRQVEVATEYKLEHQRKAGVQVCGFSVGTYDKSKELVVDPVILVYAGYIGGFSLSGFEAGFGIAVDSAGNAYITGVTSSPEASFPVTVGPDLTFNGATDAFVAKVNAAGTALVYAGYIGGSDTDEGSGIAVDSAGNAYVTGGTFSTEASFPVTVGPDLTFNGFEDAFVAKVNAAGTALVYAGYIGGSDFEQSNGITLDSAGNAYLTGFTFSTEASFPVTVGPDLTFNGFEDAFVAKVNATGTALVYAGYIGGLDFEVGLGIAVDSAGHTYITGVTNSTEASFPVTVGPDLTYNGGFEDAFVAKVNAAGTTLVYAGYIGGSNGDQCSGIAVDSAGNAYVTGSTSSTEASFPVTVGPDLTFNGDIDAFVAKVNAAGTTLVYAGYIGGSGFEVGLDIAVDSAGNAYITGETISTEASFPVTVGPDLTFNGDTDAFVAKVNAAGTTLVYAGYIGGSDTDRGLGIAVDSAGNAYITGVTSSTEASFPVTVGPDLTFNGGFVDAFVAKIADTSAPPPSSFDICLQHDSSGDFLQINSTTGDYQFTKCGPGGFTLSSTGTVRMRGSVVTLQQNGPDVRVLATITGRRGVASIRVLSSGTTFTITDRDTTNNTCACP